MENVPVEVRDTSSSYTCSSYALQDKLKYSKSMFIRCYVHFRLTLERYVISESTRKFMIRIDELFDDMIYRDDPFVTDESGYNFDSLVNRSDKKSQDVNYEEYSNLCESLSAWNDWCNAYGELYFE